METNEKVFATLKNSDRPLKGGEVAEISGIEKKNVDKAIKVLVKEGKIHSPKRCFYAPK